MVEGRLRKFYEEVVLLSQTFVVDTEKTVEQALKAAESDIGGAVTVTEFVVLPARRGRREGGDRLRRRSRGGGRHQVARPPTDRHFPKARTGMPVRALAVSAMPVRQAVV